MSEKQKNLICKYCFSSKKFIEMGGKNCLENRQWINHEWIEEPKWVRDLIVFQDTHADSTWKGYYHPSFQQPLIELIGEKITEAVTAENKRCLRDHSSQIPFLIEKGKLSEREALRKMIEGMKQGLPKYPQPANEEYSNLVTHRNAILSDLLAHLK